MLYTLCAPLSGGAFLLWIALFMHEVHAQEGNRHLRHLMDGGVRIHCDGVVRDLRSIATSSRPASVAYSRVSESERRIICSIGDGVHAIERVMPNAGEDPGDCVVIFDPDGGGIERLSYHQPRPDVLVTSANGKYVAMASIHGWSTDTADIPKLGDNDRIAKGELSLAEVNRKLPSTAVGTLRYSVWEISPVRPLWEMRFYEEGVVAGKKARFERPWGRYAKMSIPWWAINGEVSLFRGCRVSFSPDSKYFVAMDPSHGVHILNVADGSQYHCCEAKENAAPIMFSFLDGESKLGVICENLAIRVFQLETGSEQTNHHFRLPPGARVRTKQDGGFYTRVNFSLEPKKSHFGFITDGRALTLIGLENEASATPVKSIGKIGREFGAGRLDYSSDGRYLGIGYGYQSARWEVKFPTRMLMYELADVERGEIIRRIAHRSDIQIPDGDRDVPTTWIDGEFQACLVPEAGTLLYVEALPKREK